MGQLWSRWCAELTPDITVEFRLAYYPLRGSWRPAVGNPERTFASALQVFTTIFGFLVDILIWLLVVVGPFVLLVWGGRKRDGPAFSQEVVNISALSPGCQ